MTLTIKNIDSINLKDVAQEYRVSLSSLESAKSKIRKGLIKSYRVGIQRVGNFNIFVYVDPMQYMRIVSEEIKRAVIISSEYSYDQLHDYIMDFWTTRQEDHNIIKKLKSAQNKEAYFRIATRQQFRSASLRKIIKSSEVYDAS